MPRGGFREGAGGKKDVKRFSDRVRRNYESADRYFAQFLKGKDIVPKRLTTEMAIVGLIFGYVWDRGSQAWIKDAVQDTVRASAQKARQEALVIRESHQTLEKHEYGPVIGLPKIKEKPEEGTFPVIQSRPN